MKAKDEIKGGPMERRIVTAAVIRHDGKILCMRRGECRFDYLAHRFEFPGGKLDEPESPAECMARELREEIDFHTTVTEDMLVLAMDYDYPDIHPSFRVYLIDCKTAPDFKMLEHEEYRWATREELAALDWAPADAEIVRRLLAVNKI